jgi:hypothetical protein
MVYRLTSQENNYFKIMGFEWYLKIYHVQNQTLVLLVIIMINILAILINPRSNRQNIAVDISKFGSNFLL